MNNFNNNHTLRTLIVALILISFAACSGELRSIGAWTWISGSDAANGALAGTYGTQGTADAANVPGGRYLAVSWTDNSSNLWLFGGGGYDSVGSYGRLNDLWKYDGANWTWVSGSDIGYQRGVYGTQGMADAANVPGARESSISWIDNSGNLWLFGGDGNDSTGNLGILNDLWKYDGANWTWVGGNDVGYQSGVYGTQGIADAANIPGARKSSISWTDSNGNLWLFGGGGYDSVGGAGTLNDLWKYDGANWTWVSGSDVINQAGVYGTQGMADAANVPGGRYSAVSWSDSNGNLWLFGGWGYDTAGSFGKLNDLWRYDGSNWTWVSGSNVIDQAGVYGTQGVADAANIPGARWDGVGWSDSSGNLWLFGGLGYDSDGTWGDLNDLWCYDGNNWIWVGGSNSANRFGIYGTRGIANIANVPSSRDGSVSWVDSSGDLWLFGGSGYDSSWSAGFLNDLWRYQP